MFIWYTLKQLLWKNKINNTKEECWVAYLDLKIAIPLEVQMSYGN